MKNTLLLLFAFIFGFTPNLFSLNTAPIAVNDTIYVNAGRSYTYVPTNNDYDPDGDPFYIFNANFKNGSGHVTASSSSLNINIYYASGLDTITYLIRDNQNNISNIGYIFVHINPSNTMDTLTINNVRANFFPFGNAFWDFVGSSTYEVPAGSGKTTIFTSVPWIGALDQSNNLHLAGETFSSKGHDYFYGPVCDTNTFSQYSDTLWERVWKISKVEIEYHKNNYWKSSYAMPEAIANWPAKGDTSLGQNAVMAPYIDKNNDGKYIPSDGDYPKIRGDQTVFLIFNDSKKAHSESGGQALNVEVHQWAYAYNCSNDTALDHTIFMHYDIYNRSANNYHDVYLGVFTDFDIGYSYDDYVGCDSSRNLFYAYNGHDTDGFGKPYQYGANPPAQGVVFLSEPMSKFIAFNNTGTNVQTDPSNDTGFYNYMQAIWGDGTHLTYGGDGLHGNTPTNFLYSGDPNDTTTWSEKSPLTGSANPPFDRRGVGSIGPFDLSAGAIKSIDFAYVYARDITKNNFQNVTTLKNAVDKIQLYYDNDSTPCGGSFSAIAKPKLLPNSIKIYPVPTDNNISIAYLPSNKNAKYEIYNISGKLLKSGALQKQKYHNINLSNYQSGLYFVLVRDGAKTLSKKFIVR